MLRGMDIRGMLRGKSNKKSDLFCMLRGKSNKRSDLFVRSMRCWMVYIQALPQFVMLQFLAVGFISGKKNRSF